MNDMDKEPEKDVTNAEVLVALRSLRALINRCDTTALEDGSSIDTLPALEALNCLMTRIAQLEPAAECWDALCACYRITCMGSAGILVKKDNGYAHVTLNLWTVAGDPPEGSRDEQSLHGAVMLAQFIEIAVENLKAKGKKTELPTVKREQR